MACGLLAVERVRLRRLIVICFALTSGCANYDPPCAPQGDSHRRFVLDSFKLPMNTSEFSLDLNLDGKPDNQLGGVLSAADQGGALSQQLVDQGIASGTFKLTLDLQSTDPTFDRAEGATVLLSDGGNGGTFCGSAARGTYLSNSGISEERPVEFQLTLPFFDNATLPVTAAHIEFSVEGSRLASGRLNGAVRSEDFQRIAIPGIASRLTDQVRVGDALAANIQSLFDNGGVDEGCNGACRNPDGTCGKAMNGIIEECEVRTHPVVKNVIAPDVDLFDRDGRYRPNPDNTGKDSLSMGVAFTAVEVP